MIEGRAKAVLVNIAYHIQHRYWRFDPAIRELEARGLVVATSMDRSCEMDTVDATPLGMIVAAGLKHLANGRIRSDA